MTQYVCPCCGNGIIVEPTKQIPNSPHATVYSDGYLIEMYSPIGQLISSGLAQVDDVAVINAALAYHRVECIGTFYWNRSPALSSYDHLYGDNTQIVGTANATLFDLTNLTGTKIHGFRITPHQSQTADVISLHGNAGACTRNKVYDVEISSPIALDCIAINCIATSGESVRGASFFNHINDIYTNNVNGIGVSTRLGNAWTNANFFRDIVINFPKIGIYFERIGEIVDGGGANGNHFQNIDIQSFPGRTTHQIKADAKSINRVEFAFCNFWDIGGTSGKWFEFGTQCYDVNFIGCLADCIDPALMVTNGNRISIIDDYRTILKNAVTIV